jgi:hypothetical protein
MGWKNSWELQRNHHAMENNHVFFIHILQYLLIISSGNEMIANRRSSLSLEEDIFGFK